MSSMTAGSRMSTWWTLSSCAAVGSGLGQVGQRAARQVVDHVDAVALGQQPVDERRADEPGAAGDQCLHPALLGDPDPGQLSAGRHHDVIAHDGARFEHRAGAHDGPGRR